MIEAQGGDRRITEDSKRLPQSRDKIELVLGKAGYVCALEAEKVGLAAMHLGAGRHKKTDVIDPAVGVCLKVKVGDRLDADQPFAVLHVNDPKKVEQATKMLKDAVVVGDRAPAAVNLICQIIGS